MRVQAKLTMAILAAALLQATPSGAADADGKFALEGGGAAACSKFVAAAEAKAPEMALFSGWVDGYFSAINQIEKTTYDITPWQTTELTLVLLTTWCKEHPKEQFGLAVNRLANALMADRLTTFSATTMIGTAASATPIYEEVLLRTNRALVQKGYLKGEADAKYSPQVKAALEKFQKDRKIKVSGLPDQRTLYALFVPEPPPAPKK